VGRKKRLEEKNQPLWLEETLSGALHLIL